FGQEAAESGAWRAREKRCRRVAFQPRCGVSRPHSRSRDHAVRRTRHHGWPCQEGADGELQLRPPGLPNSAPAERPHRRRGARRVEGFSVSGPERPRELALGIRTGIALALTSAIGCTAFVWPLLIGRGSVLAQNAAAP